MTAAEAVASLRLARTEGIGPLTYRRLLERHGSAIAALPAAMRWTDRKGAHFALPPADAAVREIEAVARLGGRLLFLQDPDYPPLLALLTDPPPALAVLGDPAALQGRLVALVGARNASAAGRRIAEDMAEALAQAGVGVASGLARGIDTAAHLGALRGGRTIAVLPGGLDLPYPAENAALVARIAEAGGAVVAESPLGTAPLARHFPKRNRIVAGLVLGVVVVEAAHRSGTLITARLALEAGREVYAVPGSPLDPRSAGANDLLRQGAHLAEHAQDVLEHLPDAPSTAPMFDPASVWEGHGRPPQPAMPAFSGSEDAGQVLELLGFTPVSVDEVLRRCHLSPSALQTILTDLELDGHVEALAGNRIVRIRAGGAGGQ